MKEEEIVDRLRKMTGSWAATFRLLDKYEDTTDAPLKCELPQPSLDLTVQNSMKKADLLEEKVVKFSSKKIRIKKGSVPFQVKEILEAFPDSSLPEIGKLGDWSFHDQKHMTSGLSRTLNTMMKQKTIVRKKVNGLYSYRLVEKK